MNRLSDLLLPESKIMNIAPPYGSFEDWDRFLEQCREAGVMALEYGQLTPIAAALLKRWRWVRESRERGIPYQEAATAFDAAIERERDAMRATMKSSAIAAKRAREERDGRKRGRAAGESDDLLEYAGGRLG